MKVRKKKIEELIDLKPVTDEEFEELLDDRPKREKGKRKRGRKDIPEEFF